ncbi:ABC transporter ATP-binding protein [Marinobacter sp. EVN1]|uniref:ATP-binding cassette domain-containing protein n=1 Tax=Marinobacter sp. EVN1 TaxID=1397532 RepID=UPI0003B8BCF6|nr:ATP-binding cassette domain-containing protein [Marinobacter sp. EVN1]ERS81025.1 ABC transporter ATP-binding protein [Marinobacter sp. EVN1]
MEKTPGHAGPLADDGCLHLQNVSLELHGHHLLALNETIRPGEVLTIMGPSGSGKSTLLAWIAGFMSSSFRATGRAILDGDDITGRPAEQTGVGLLFQDPLLFPHLSVAGNVRFGARGAKADMAERVESALASVGLEGLGQRDPDTLSGGQRARAALVRLILSRPRAILLDEPFSKLDAPLRRELRATVFGHLRQQNVPAMLVTHDQEDAEAAGGRTVTID